jgi:hypothetical protein
MPAIPVPAELAKYGVRGIFVGGCVDRGDGSSFRRRAHAHCQKVGGQYGEWHGWICFRSPKRLWVSGTNRPSQLLWHEVAHIWRRSWSQKQCTQFARRQVRVGGEK